MKNILEERKKTMVGPEQRNYLSEILRYTRLLIKREFLKIVIKLKCITYIRTTCIN